MTSSQPSIYLGKEEGIRFIFKHIFMIFSVLSTLPGISVAADKPPVFVSIVPQKYIVQQISKDLVAVQTMVQPGSSPATYEPKPQLMADLSTAKRHLQEKPAFNLWCSIRPGDILRMPMG
jgi:hypothetical protein